MNMRGTAPAQSSPVKTVMRWPVAAVGGATPLQAIAEALVTDELGALAVVEKDRLIGVISERDVVREVARGADPEHTRASEMMSTEPVTVGPDDTVAHAARLMRDAAVRHLPVVDGDRIVGFLSIRDVLAPEVEAAATS